MLKTSDSVAPQHPLKSSALELENKDPALAAMRALSRQPTDALDHIPGPKGLPLSLIHI